MAASPATSTTNNAETIKPVFSRVEQTTSHDCAFACIATITGKSLTEVMQIAVEKGLPATGPYWVTDELIAKIFASFGFVSTLYKEITKGLVDMPDVAIAMVEYRPDDELGRHVVFVRDQSNQKAITSYIIDPAYWIEPKLHVRNDFANLKPAWYIGVHPMAQKAGKK